MDSLFEKMGNKIRNGKYEIIIVDNASQDDTHEKIREYFNSKKTLFEDLKKGNKCSKSVCFYQSNTNNGYAKGVNLASKFANGEFLVVINPDAELVEEDFGKIIEAFKSREKLGIAGLRVLGYDGKREKTAGKFYNPFSFLMYSMGLEDLISLRFAPDKLRKVDFISGGFIVFRHEIFKKLKGYDEDFFMYIEDMDICYRAKKLGFQTYFLSYAAIKHRGQGSSSREFAIVNIYQGIQIFSKKHYSYIAQQYVKNLLSLKAALIIFIGTVIGKKELVSTYSKALKTIV